MDEYNALILREQWDRKYKSATQVFFVINGLYVVSFIGVAAFLARTGDAPPGGVMRLAGVSAMALGLMLVVGTGLVKKWRWAAIVATLWCCVTMLSALYTMGGSTEQPGTRDERNAAYANGAGAGAICPGILSIIMLISCGRAALAKTPPARDEPRAIPGASPDPFNPYGRTLAAPEKPRPTVALSLIGVGALFTIAGVGALTAGVMEQLEAVVISEKRWKPFQGDGFTVDFPAEPVLQDGVVPGELVEFSRSYKVETGFHVLEVVHYRLGSMAYVRPDGLQQELDHQVESFGGEVTARSNPAFPGASALRYEVENAQANERTVMLAVNKGNDVYMVMGCEANADQSRAAARFVDSFSLTR
ncbi:MAG: hypothetical protein H6841_10760 [Planctomycetes bacterium]|nr:hypothetical protein [Planctomycetota bacterium]MCB9936279.1 hypothetical protein [Planctomycetota bacterium]